LFCGRNFCPLPHTIAERVEKNSKQVALADFWATQFSSGVLVSAAAGCRASSAMDVILTHGLASIANKTLAGDAK